MWQYTACPEAFFFHLGQQPPITWKPLTFYVSIYPSRPAFLNFMVLSEVLSIAFKLFYTQSQFLLFVEFIYTNYELGNHNTAACSDSGFNAKTVLSLTIIEFFFSLTVLWKLYLYCNTSAAHYMLTHLFVGEFNEIKFLQNPSDKYKNRILAVRWMQLESSPMNTRTSITWGD